MKRFYLTIAFLLVAVLAFLGWRSWRASRFHTYTKLFQFAAPLVPPEHDPHELPVWDVTLPLTSPIRLTSGTPKDRNGVFARYSEGVSEIVGTNEYFEPDTIKVSADYDLVFVLCTGFSVLAPYDQTKGLFTVYSVSRRKVLFSYQLADGELSTLVGGRARANHASQRTEAGGRLFFVVESVRASLRR